MLGCLHSCAFVSLVCMNACRRMSACMRQFARVTCATRAWGRGCWRRSCMGVGPDQCTAGAARYMQLAARQ